MSQITWRRSVAHLLTDHRGPLRTPEVSPTGIIYLVARDVGTLASMIAQFEPGGSSD
jgi:hypothetical protein